MVQLDPRIATGDVTWVRGSLDGADSGFVLVGVETVTPDSSSRISVPDPSFRTVRLNASSRTVT